jgi:hypothetical protein
MFTSLAVKNEFLIFTPKELSTITWTWKKGLWTFNDIQKHPNNFFHPVKQFDNHSQFRKKLQQLEKMESSSWKMPQLFTLSKDYLKEFFS